MSAREHRNDSVSTGAVRILNNGEHIHEYLDSAAAASRRSRFIVVVLVTASVLSFMALWNSLGRSWTDMRVKNLEDLIRYWPLDGEVERRLGEDWRRRGELERLDVLRNLARGMGYFPDAASSEESSTILRSLEIRLFHLRRVRADRVLNIDIPVVGASFDVNDLAIFSGITFFIILLLLRYSLARECQNLCVFADIAGADLDRTLYNLLATRQFLTVPPMRHRSHAGNDEIDPNSPSQRYLALQGYRGSAFWRAMPKFMVWAPALIIGTIVINDYRTFAIGAELSMERTKESTFLSVAFLVLVCGVAASAYRMWRRIDSVWRELDEEIWKVESADKGEA